MSGIVYAADKYVDNAEMIAAAAKLGHIDAEASSLDLTYGGGAWWRLWAPADLFAPVGVDFRATPFVPRTFSQLFFDPPYVSVGGRETSGIQEMLRRYGIDEAPKTPGDLQRTLINPGLDECRRLAPAVLVVKCMDYISSNQLWLGSHYTLAKAMTLGFSVLDKLERTGSGGPQPKERTKKCPRCAGTGVAWVLEDRDARPPCEACEGTGRVPSVQGHARRNISTMWILTLTKRQRMETSWPGSR